MPTKEVKIPNFPQLYKIVELLPEGKQLPPAIIASVSASV